jgi:N-acyl-D-amino-acid deacylase
VRISVAAAVAELPRVLFDPEAIRDVATFENPTEHSEGMQHVLANGVLVIDAGR